MTKLRDIIKHKKLKAGKLKEEITRKEARLHNLKLTSENIKTFYKNKLDQHEIYKDIFKTFEKDFQKDKNHTLKQK